MESESEPPSNTTHHPLFETLQSNQRQEDPSLPFPFMLSSTNMPQQEPPPQPTPSSSSPSERIILINPITQGMIVIEGNSTLNSLLHELAHKDGGHPPASTASIEAMPSVEMMIDTQQDNNLVSSCGGVECVVCLEEWKVGEIAKEMPCKHRFHEECIVKWLKIHGSCPICRYKMPIGGDEFERKMIDGEMRRRVEREVWVSFSFNRERSSSNRDSNQTSLASSSSVFLGSSSYS